MGLDRAKSLLPVRADLTFLDVIAARSSTCGATLDVALPLLFMNSFRTHDDTLAALARHDDLAVDDLPLDFLQNREPKLRADDLTPVAWPADPRSSGARPAMATSTPRWRRPASSRPCSTPASATRPSPTPTTSAPLRTRR